MIGRYVIGALAALAVASPARADFASCKQGIIAEAVRNGVSEATAAAALKDVTADPKILDYENFQPEFKTPIWDYLAGLVDDERVRDGKAAMAANAKALALAEQRFGVSQYVIAAIWGVESNFGEDMGGRPLVQSLTTLACSPSRRPQYFRGELMSTLKIVDRGDIPLEKLKGSWAGAFGQTQFMPSTFLRLAVDLDGDGGATSSIIAAGGARFDRQLSEESGWRPGETWGFEVKLPAGYDGPSGRKNRHPMSFGRRGASRRVDGGALGEGRRALLLPAGK